MKREFNMTKIIATRLDENGEEQVKFTKLFETPSEADDFMDAHEQDFADDTEIYAIYRVEEADEFYEDLRMEQCEQM